MGYPDYHAIYPAPRDAELCNGYYDGRRKDSPEPSGNRHPACIHGVNNGRDNIGIKHGQTAQQRRDVWALIEATCRDEPRAAQEKRGG